MGKIDHGREEKSKKICGLHGECFLYQIELGSKIYDDQNVLLVSWEMRKY